MPHPIRSFVPSLAWLLLGVLVPHLARAQPSFTITDLGTFGGTSSVANAINASGQVVGSYTDSGGVYHAFRYSSGSGLVDLLPFGGTYASANAINDAGDFVGVSLPFNDTGTVAFRYTAGEGMVVLGTANNLGKNSTANGINASGTIVGKANVMGGDDRAVIFTTGGVVDLGTLGGRFSSAQAINDAGLIVGSATTSDGASQVFSYTGGVMTNLGSLGGGDAAANAVSASGAFIAGYSSIAGEAEKHAFVYTTAGGMVDLGTLGGIEAFSMGVNNAGQIVGVSYLSNFQYNAFYVSGTTMYNLNDLVPDLGGWELTSANAINDLGQIVGYGSFNGENRAFLLTAIPEPSTYAVIAGLGALGLAIVRRRRRSRAPSGRLSRLAPKLRLTVLALAAGLGLAVTSPAQVLANLVNDYAASGLPLPATGTGAWNFYASSTPDPTAGTLTALTFQGIGNAGQNGYGLTDGGYNVPAVSAFSIFGDGANPAGSFLAWHPGNGSPAYTVLSWTAGAGESGPLEIQGTFSRLGEPGGVVGFSIYVNGVQFYSQSTLNQGSVLNFDFNASILTGQTVSFVLDPASGYAGDESLISASITSTIPEPSTYAALAGAAALGLAIYCRRRVAISQKL